MEKLKKYLDDSIKELDELIVPEEERMNYTGQDAEDYGHVLGMRDMAHHVRDFCFPIEQAGIKVDECILPFLELAHALCNNITMTESWEFTLDDDGLIIRIGHRDEIPYMYYVNREKEVDEITLATLEQLLMPNFPRHGKAKAELARLLDLMDKDFEYGGEDFIGGYFQEKDKSWTAFDNSTGECNVEEFSERIEAIKFANGREATNKYGDTIS